MSFQDAFQPKLGAPGSEPTAYDYSRTASGVLDAVADRRPRPDYSKISQGVLGAVADRGPVAAENSKFYDPTAATAATDAKKKLGLGDYLQLGAAGASVLGAVLDTPETQKFYGNNAPITNQQFDPSRALMNNAFSTNAARQDVTNSYSASGANANLQNLYANKFKADADVTTHYDQMNKQATTDYENRLGQRTAENNQMRYHTDDVNMANRAQYMNNIYGALGTVNQVGAGFNKQASTDQGMKWLMQIDPEAAKWVEAGGDIKDYVKKKQGLTELPSATTTTKKPD